jgi:hypothetical protein
MDSVRNVWAILSRSSAIDSETKVLSIFDVLEEITITSDVKVGGGENGKANLLKFPFEINAMWERDDALTDTSWNARISIADPNGHEIGKAIFPLKFSAKRRRLRTRTKLPGILFSGYGTYTFGLFIEGKHRSVLAQEIPLSVKSKIRI